MKTLLLIISTLLAAAFAGPTNHLVARKCKTYTPSGPLFRIEAPPQRVSPALYCSQPGTGLNEDFGTWCPSNSSCVIGNSEGVLPVKPTINISLPNSGDANDIYNLVASATGLDFKSGVNSTLSQGNAGFCFGAGTGVFVTAAYTLNCTSGTLSNCDGGGNGPADGTAVQVCAVGRADIGPKQEPVALIDLASQNVTQQQAANLTDNPLQKTARSAASRVLAGYGTAAALVLFAALWIAL